MSENRSLDIDAATTNKSVERKSWITKKRIALGVTALLLVQNADTLDDLRSFVFAGGSMTPEVSGCEYTPPTLPPITTTTEPGSEPTTTTTVPETTTTNPTADIESEVANKTSSVNNNSFFNILKNIPKFIDQKGEMYEHLEASFVSNYSGINFEIFNTGEETERTIDIAAFDELFHLSLSSEVEHFDPEKQHLMDCVRQKVITDKELAGRTVQVLIPSTRDYCISNWALKKVSDPRDNDCTQSGAALPKIELEFLFWKPYSEQLFILTAGDFYAENQDQLNRRINELLVHEAVHRIFYELGVSPRKEQDEQFTEYLENAILLPYQQADEEQIIGVSGFGRLQQLSKTLPEAVQYQLQTVD